MNNKILLLTKIFLKNGSGLVTKGKKRMSQLIVIAALVLAFLPLAGNIAHFASVAYDIFAEIGQEGVILSIGSTLSAFTIFFFGLFYVINTFYFSNDIENLLPLPLRPSEILGAKFITVVIYEYLTELIVGLPVMGAFGVRAGAGPIYYLYALFVFLLLPLIPLAIASIIVMIIMRFTNLGKNKDRFRVIGGIVAVMISLGLNMVLQRYTSTGMNPEQLQNMLMEGNNSLIGITSKMFPTSKWAAEAMTNTNSIFGLTNILLFIGVSILAFIVFLYIGELLYFKGVLGISEAASKRKKLKESEFEKSVTPGSPLKAYLKKEIRILFRTPTYFINCVLTSFLMPVIILLPLIAQPNFGESIKEIRKFEFNSEMAGIFVACAFAGMIFIAAMNGVTSTSITREGQNLFVNKYLPVSYKTQITAKILSGVIISIIGMVMILITAIAVMMPPVYLIILSIIVAVPAMFFMSITGIIFDLFNPKLDWDSEQKAVKRSWNVALNSLIGMLIAGLVIFAAIKFQLNMITATLALVCIFSLVDYLLYVFATTKGVKLMSRIED